MTVIMRSNLLQWREVRERLLSVGVTPGDAVLTGSVTEGIYRYSLFAVISPPFRAILQSASGLRRSRRNARALRANSAGRLQAVRGSETNWNSRKCKEVALLYLTSQKGVAGQVGDVPGRCR